MKMVRGFSEGRERESRRGEDLREKTMYFDLEEFRVRRFAENHEETEFRSDCRRLKSYGESTGLKRKISSA